MASAVRTAIQAARTLSQPAALPTRRLNKRTKRSSPSTVLASLTELYHLTPTFVPTANPSLLSSHLTHTLTPESAATSRPKPHRLGDWVEAQRLLDNERVRLESSGSNSTSILGLDLKASATGVAHFSFSPEEAFDHRESFYHAYTKGAEPPLGKRVRKIVDVLHGTEAGGRAGVKTTRENAGRAKEWREGLVRAKEQARERERARERDEEDFARAFEGEGEAKRL
ncbi:hypothetical protein JCM8547_008546 [Rhodosporidiobolus lusitaniae]